MAGVCNTSERVGGIFIYYRPADMKQREHGKMNFYLTQILTDNGWKLPLYDRGKFCLHISTAELQLTTLPTHSLAKQHERKRQLR